MPRNQGNDYEKAEPCDVLSLKELPSVGRCKEKREGCRKKVGKQRQAEKVGVRRHVPRLQASESSPRDGSRHSLAPSLPTSSDTCDLTRQLPTPQ
ncbi:hypothetical protein GW17_00024482 [Ensete ventricosum]|nr:hypothetical protein GW17_00024482 [Ensete ventricosum]